MSDRPCNLQEWRRMQRKYADHDVQLRADEHGWPTVYVDGQMVVSFLKLPTEAECGVYGGTCEC